MGYPDCRILMVSNMPAFLNCSITTGMSNLMGVLSLFGLRQRTNHGLHLDIFSRSCCKLSLNRAATVGVRGFMVTKRPKITSDSPSGRLKFDRWDLPLAPLGRVLLCDWPLRGFAIAPTSGSLLDVSNSITSGLRMSRFLSKKPSTEYQTWPAKCRI